ncbi:hypothetical protein SELMODRAFT_439207 [Selaginella moellendorffii]|uniref:Uncharacterized protein n=2 Tax=Selaginella moellendorffii TaxID=88036 RepID=D8R184_SELML|nr:hypothetical protein SELMODRAFT_439207 [Selaginella moellendorffii]
MALAMALAMAAISLSTARFLDDSSAISMVIDGISPARFTELLGEGHKVARFHEFATRHKRVYGSLVELRERFVTFSRNLELIEETNRKELPYTLAVNQFADMSWEEFKKHNLFSSQNCSATATNSVRAFLTPPSKKDWRDDKIVSPVKNQQHCGSCWTFSTTGALESAHAQATGKMVVLSEQQLVDCAGGYNNFGCSGGLPSQAFEYIRYNGGLDTEDSYPYTAHDGKCMYNQNSIGAKVYDVVNITEGAEDELIHAVAFNRPVSIAYEVLKDFRFYKSGVYTSNVCGTGPDTVNHAVLAVGYNRDAPVPYWIIKNSWGESFGLDGYFYMEMGKNMCGIATCASYPVVPEDFN